jgi:hypothetical protein
VVGNGIKIRFCHDVWLDECPLRIQYPRLFNICRQQDWAVAESHNIDWNFEFRRNLRQEDLDDLEDLVASLETVEVTDRRIS